MKKKSGIWFLDPAKNKYLFHSSLHGQLTLLCKLWQMVCLAYRASNFESFPSLVPKPQWWSYCVLMLFRLRNSFHAPPINQQIWNGNKKNIWTIKRLFGGFFSVSHFSVKGGNKTCWLDTIHNVGCIFLTSSFWTSGEKSEETLVVWKKKSRRQCGFREGF